MRYMLLIYLEDAKVETMTRGERAILGNGMLDYDDELQRQDHFVFSGALKPPAEATTIRYRDGMLSISDGPFMQAGEHLSGFTMVQARDLNAAIQLAARMPLASIGAIEVRPIDILERVPL